MTCAQPGDSCAEATCLRYQGCVSAPRQNGAACDDGNRCTSDDICTLGVCSGTPLDACEVDPFKCYAASGGTPGTTHIALHDRFGTTPLDLLKANLACTPASDGPALLDGTRYLSCSRVRVPAGVQVPGRTLEVSDRFGTSTLRVVRPLSYCAPAEKPGTPATLPLDEFACYRVRGGVQADRVIDLVDEFEQRSTKVLHPDSVCVPARRDDAALIDPKRQLTCYTVRDADHRRASQHQIALTSALSSETLRLRKGRTLCVPSTIEPCAQVSFASSGGSYTGSYFCGGKAFDPPPVPPYVGAVYDAASGGDLLHDLGGGCIYFGGGASNFYPATQSPAGATYHLAASSCEGPDLAMVATGSPASSECARGPASFSICLNNPAQRCTRDSECPGNASGQCSPAPRCFSGPPQPFHSFVDVCLVTPVAADVTATVNPDTGSLALLTQTNVLVYLTYDTASPCPRCVAGVCTAGSRAGRACSEGVSADQTSLDCPPRPDQFYLVLGPGSRRLSTDPVSMSAADGLFCPGQLHPGAFGDPLARRIELTRGPAGSLRDGEPHAASLLDMRCDAASGNPLVDQLSDFPGPEAFSVSGAVQLTK